MTRQDVRDLAREMGFEKDALADVRPVETPKAGPLHPQAQSLTGDAREIMPGAKSVLVLAYPYRPYRENPGEAEADAYYVEGNRAHENALRLAERLRERGVAAQMTASLRVKPLAARAGLGRQGRNTLIAVDEFGTRVSLQTIVTDLEPDAGQDDEIGLDERCLTCRACVDACPTGALRGDGTLDIDRCVRAQPENQPLREDLSRFAGASLLGCDLCQRVCPRNAAVDKTDLPDGLRACLRLDRLLAGDYKGLIPYLGKNNARRLRLMNRAALAAANRERTDLLPLLEKLTEEDNPLGEQAVRSIRRLNGIKKE